MTCELKDCAHWRWWKKGCRGAYFRRLYGRVTGLDPLVVGVAHRCCGYHPRGFKGTWYWPIPEGHEGGGYMRGCPEALKMWLDAGLPEDFCLPGQRKAEAV